jgi:hypothetical protein
VYPSLKRLAKTVVGLATYLENNAAAIAKYAGRWRHGEIISAALVDKTSLIDVAQCVFCDMDLASKVMNSPENDTKRAYNQLILLLYGLIRGLFKNTKTWIIFLVRVFPIDTHHASHLNQQGGQGFSFQPIQGGSATLLQLVSGHEWSWLWRFSHRSCGLLPVCRGRKPVISRIRELFIKPEDVHGSVFISNRHHQTVGKTDPCRHFGKLFQC